MKLYHSHSNGGFLRVNFLLFFSFAELVLTILLEFVPLDQRFALAARYFNSFTGDLAQWSDEEKWSITALFWQATHGPCCSPKPCADDASL